MKYLFGLVVLLVGCSMETEQSYSSREYKEKCNEKCLKNMGTEVDWVGELSGTCYCK